jgi:hypothetical protein
LLNLLRRGRAGGARQIREYAAAEQNLKICPYLNKELIG